MIHVGYFGNRCLTGLAFLFQGNERDFLRLDVLRIEKRLNVFVKNLNFSVCQIFESGKCIIDFGFALRRNAQFTYTLTEGTSAGELAENHTIACPAYFFCRHDFVGFAVFDHAVLMNSGRMREGIGTDHGFVRLDGEAGHGRHKLRRRNKLTGVDINAELKEVITGFNRHDNFFESAVTGSFAKTVDRALNLTSTAVDYAGQRIGDGKSEIVVAVNRPNGLVCVVNMLAQVANKSTEFRWNSISDGIRNVDRGSAFADRRFNDAVQEFRLRAGSVFAGELDIVGVFLCDANGFNSPRDYLLRRHVELLLHVKRRSCNERMNAASRSCGNSLAGFSHIGRICSGKRTNRRVANHLGDCTDGFKVSGRSSSKTSFNHINTKELKLFGNAEFVLRAHACAGTLFSVTKGCIENKKLVSCSYHCFFWSKKLLRSEPH